MCCVLYRLINSLIIYCKKLFIRNSLSKNKKKKVVKYYHSTGVLQVGHVFVCSNHGSMQFLWKVWLHLSLIPFPPSYWQIVQSFTFYTVYILSTDYFETGKRFSGKIGILEIKRITWNSPGLSLDSTSKVWILKRNGI